ncbi:MAG: type II toxin-antitoxin system PemK/MazF family toxin [Solirubrobacterales bacterium]
MTTERRVRRGDVFTGDLDPVVGHEQAGRRPVLIVSIDQMNSSAAELVIAVPLTTKDRGSELHVQLDPPEGGLDRVSFALPEMARVLSTGRLGRRLGRASADSVEMVARRVGILIGLGRSR